MLNELQWESLMEIGTISQLIRSSKIELNGEVTISSKEFFKFSPPKSDMAT